MFEVDQLLGNVLGGSNLGSCPNPYASLSTKFRSGFRPTSRPPLQLCQRVPPTKPGCFCCGLWCRQFVFPKTAFGAFPAWLSRPLQHPRASRQGQFFVALDLTCSDKCVKIRLPGFPPRGQRAVGKQRPGKQRPHLCP